MILFSDKWKAEKQFNEWAEANNVVKCAQNTFNWLMTTAAGIALLQRMYQEVFEE